VRDYKFPSLFINQFFPRPGTPAAKMQKVPTQEVDYRFFNQTKGMTIELVVSGKFIYFPSDYLFLYL